MPKQASLVDQLVKLSSVPRTGLEKKLESLILEAGYDKETISLEEMRKVLMEYLQDTFFELPSA